MSGSLSFDQAIGRITSDGVVTKDELNQLTGRPAVKSAGDQKVVTALDAFSAKMTPTAFDVFSAAKTAAATASPGSSVLDILSGKVGVAPSLPAWFPASFDWPSRIAAVKQMLLDQGEPAANIGPGMID